MSLEKVLVEYGLELSQLRKDFAELKSTVTGVDKTIQTSADKTQKNLNDISTTVKGKLTGAFTALGEVIVATFAVKKIVDFTVSSIKLAEAAEEIKGAFDKLNDATLLGDLRKAVAGTVSDVNLMKIAIQANNFKVPLKDLAEAFAFAKLKADETGRSTEELAATIIESIGRNSPRALVQLGISQAAINEKVEETGSLYKGLTGIIHDTLANAGEDTDTAADKTERLNAQFENLQVEIGEKLLPAATKFLETINKWIESLQIAFKSIRQIKEEVAAASNAQFDQNEVDMFLKFLDDSEDKYKTLAAAARDYNNFAINEVIRRQNEAVTVSEKLALAGDKVYQSYKRQIAAVAAYVIEQQQTTEKTEETTEAVEEEAKFYIKLSDILKIVFTDIQKTSNSMASAVTPIKQTSDALVDLIVAAFALDDGLLAKSSADWQGFVDRRTKETEDGTEKMKENWQGFFDFVSSGLSSLDQSFEQSSDFKLSLLEDELSQKKISQQKFDSESKKIEREEAKREKEMAIFNIIINTARAIVAALPNPILAALAAATGGVQLGVVVAEPLPFKKGGVIPKGERIIRVNEEGQEFIANARATRKYTKELRAMNEGKFDKMMQMKYSLKAELDDYRLLREMNKGTHASKHNTDRIISALREQRKPHRF